MFIWHGDIKGHRTHLSNKTPQLSRMVWRQMACFANQKRKNRISGPRDALHGKCRRKSCGDFAQKAVVAASRDQSMGNIQRRHAGLYAVGALNITSRDGRTCTYTRDSLTLPGTRVRFMGGRDYARAKTQYSGLAITEEGLSCKRIGI